jgi:hypothetical protein
MDASTKGMSVRMVKKKELEYVLLKVERKKEENGKWINYMDLESVNLVMAVIGENTRMATGKDMEYMIIMVEGDTSGNGCRVTDTGMEYTDGQVEKYIMDNGNRKKEMAMDIKEMQMAQNTTDSTRMTRKKDKES